MAWPPLTHRDVVDAVTALQDGGGTSSGGVEVFRVDGVGDGVTDDSAAAQAAYDAANAAGGGVVYFPPGTYLCGGLIAYSNTTTLGAGPGATVLKQTAASTHLLSVNPWNGGTTDPADNVHNVVFADLTMLGTVETDGFAEHTHLLNLNAVTHAYVARVHFVGFRGDGLYIGSGNDAGIERHNVDVHVDRCFFDGVNKDNRNGLSIIDGDDIEISNCTFTRCSNAAMPGAIDIEPDRYPFHVVRNIRILNNTFVDVGGAGGCVSISITPDQTTVTAPAQNIYVEGNTFNSPDTMCVYVYSETPAPSDTTPVNNIFIRGNTSLAGTYPYELSGVRGVIVSDNVWCDHTANVRLGVWYPIHEVHVINDTYYRLADATTGWVYRNYQGTRLTFESNRFVNCGKPDGTLGIIYFQVGSGGYGNGVRFAANHAVGARTTAWAGQHGGITIDAASNYFIDNYGSPPAPSTAIFGHQRALP